MTERQYVYTLGGPDGGRAAGGAWGWDAACVGGGVRLSYTIPGTIPRTFRPTVIHRAASTTASPAVLAHT